MIYLGEVIKCVHSHRVAQSVVSVDSSTRSKEQVFYGLHGVLSERNQVLSLVFTKSVSAEERLSIAHELRRRYESHNHELPIIFRDCCCNDIGWLRPLGRLRPSGCLDVRIDGAHLLSRYENSLGKNNKTAVKIIMKELAKALVGDGQVYEDQREGNVIYEQFSVILSQFAAREEEAGVSEQLRTITNETWRTHANEEVHVKNCVGPLGEDKYLVYSRFFDAVLARSNAGIEGFWRHLNRIVPEVCGVRFGVALTLAFTTSWNQAREVIYCDEWEYVHVSSRDLISTQYLLHPPECIVGAKGFGKLSLGTEVDSQHVFGISELYQDENGELPVIPEDIQQDLADSIFTVINQVIEPTPLPDNEIEEICNGVQSVLQESGGFFSVRSLCLSLCCEVLEQTVDPVSFHAVQWMPTV